MHRIERYPQEWEQSVFDLLLEINESVDQAHDKQSGVSQTQLAEFEQRYDRLIEQGI